LVIPAALRRKYKLKGGTRVAVGERDGQITLTPNPYDALLALRGCLSDVKEDVEAWMMKERRKEREREDAKFEGML
jgi:bifunctional DNA-binding transcriptional regulator/antitoxin component of YhaV-PrlF toxin-antitoxin module